MPALRERREDIPELVSHFLSQCADEGLPWKSIDESALDRMQAYHWPGNVREMENLVRRLAALYSEETIGIQAIEAELAVEPPPEPTNRAGNGIGDAVEIHLRDYFAAHGNVMPPAGLYDRVLKEVERPLISQSLAATRGNQLRAAKLLGLNRNTLRKKIRELNIPVLRSPK